MMTDRLIEGIIGGMLAGVLGVFLFLSCGDQNRTKIIETANNSDNDLEVVTINEPSVCVEPCFFVCDEGDTLCVLVAETADYAGATLGVCGTVEEVEEVEEIPADEECFRHDQGKKKGTCKKCHDH